MIQYLIIGANGLIGRHLSNICRKKEYSWIGTYYKRKVSGGLYLDITSEVEVRKFILEKKPQHIIHCSNLAGGADFCEANPSEAELFHLKGTQFIGKAAQEINASLVFFSSDYVFSGKKNKAYNETDTPDPINTYGKIKVKAEEWLKKNLEKHIILRTTNVYGWDPDTVTPNFMMRLYLNAKNKKKCIVPSYLFGNPIYAGDLADLSIYLCQKNIYGLFHAVGDEQINRYEWAERIFLKFKLEKEMLSKGDTPGKGVAPRPLQSNLSNELIKRIAKVNFKTIDEGLDFCYNSYLIEN